MDGWIKIHRRLLAWEWWDDAVMVKSYISMLLLCSRKPSRWHGVVLAPGQFITSRSHLTTILGISEQQVRTVLKRLVETGEISLATTRNYTLVTVCNWSEYQASNQPENQENEQENMKMQPSGQPTDNQPETNRKPTDNHNQEERQREDIPPVIGPPVRPVHGGDAPDRVTSPGTTEQRSKRFVKPTVEEVAAYCRERKNGIDPQRFWDYYEAKGWIVGKTPMKDWRACVRTWERSATPQPGGAVRHGYDFAPDETGTGKQDWEAGKQ